VLWCNKFEYGDHFGLIFSDDETAFSCCIRVTFLSLEAKDVFGNFLCNCEASLKLATFDGWKIVLHFCVWYSLHKNDFGLVFIAVQIENHTTLYFRERAQSKCGTFDYLDHRPTGGDKKVSCYLNINHKTSSFYRSEYIL